VHESLRIPENGKDPTDRYCKKTAQQFIFYLFINLFQPTATKQSSLLSKKKKVSLRLWFEKPYVYYTDHGRGARSVLLTVKERVSYLVVIVLVVVWSKNFASFSIGNLTFALPDSLYFFSTTIMSEEIEEKQRGTWSSRWAFYFAAIGAAVGFGESLYQYCTRAALVYFQASLLTHISSWYYRKRMAFP
jgi:hypothetical protein